MGRNEEVAVAVLVHAAIQGLRLLQPGSGDMAWPLESSPGSPVSAQRMRQGKEITHGPRLSSHLPSRPPQAAPDPKHLTTEEGGECSLALNLGRKRSQCVENRQPFARAHACTHTCTHAASPPHPPTLVGVELSARGHCPPHVTRNLLQRSEPRHLSGRLPGSLLIAGWTVAFSSQLFISFHLLSGWS